MKLKGWVATAAIVGGLVAYRGCLNQQDAPDEQLAAHFGELCEIARHNVETPEKGVRKLGRYMGKHLDDILGDFGGTIATIEKIGDDDKHDARARVARDRIGKPLRACERDWMRFADAVESDPEASELMARAMERLSRTLDILLGAGQLELRTLPKQLERALTR